MNESVWRHRVRIASERARRKDRKAVIKKKRRRHKQRSPERRHHKHRCHKEERFCARSPRALPPELQRASSATYLVGSRSSRTSSQPPFKSPIAADVEASERWYEDDLVDPLVTLGDDGSINIPEGPGMGYTVNRAKLERYTTEQKEFSV